jgi:hypothetical protein
MDDSTSPVIVDEPHIEKSKSHSRDHEEVHRRDCVLMIAKKRHPSLLLTGVGCSFREATRDACEADGEFELLELGVDFTSTPTILVGQPTNECLQFSRDRRSPWTTLRNGPPVQEETLAVSANHGVRLDDHERVFPARPEPEECYPERAVNRREPGPRSCLSIRCELLAQSKLDDCLLIPTSEKSSAATKKYRDEEEGSHQAEILRDLFVETQTDSLLQLGVP